MSRDLFKNAGYSHLGGIGGIHCPCCDNKLSKKRKGRTGRNLFNRMRRSTLTQALKKELSFEL